MDLGKCNRWSAKHKKVVTICQPKVIQKYNHGMSGVDLFDKFRAKYRATFRKTVWYYPIFRFLLNSTLVNNWLYYRKMRQQTQLEFTQQIVSSLRTPLTITATKSHVPRPVSESGRYDGINRNIVMGATQRRCGVCKKCSYPMHKVRRCPPCSVLATIPYS